MPATMHRSPNPISRRQRIAAAIGLVGFAGAALWFAAEPRGALEAGAYRGQTEQVDAAVAAGADMPAGTPWSTTQQREHPVRKDDPIYGTETPAELAWLNRHLYPSEAERRDAAVAGPSVRNDLLKPGPYTPTQLARASAYMLAYSHDARIGAQFLERAAIEGSIYALEELGLRYSDGPLKNRVLSEAYYRAAALRGHWGLAFRLAPGLTQQQALFAELRAHQIVSNMNRVRRREGRPPLVYDQRPGLDQVLGALTAESHRVDNSGGIAK